MLANDCFLLQHTRGKLHNLFSKNYKTVIFLETLKDIPLKEIYEIPKAYEQLGKAEKMCCFLYYFIPI